MVMIVALLVAFAIPCLYLYYGIYRRDFFETGNRTLIGVCFVWGLAAYFLAFWANRTIISLGWISYDNMIRFSAPVVEEILKGAILVYLISRTDFKYVVDGAIYGFTAGIGFAVIENFEYVAGHPETALALAIARVFSTNLIHATASGSIGIALGLSRFERSNSTRRWLTLFASAVGAMSLHMAFNNLVDRGAPILLAIAVGCLGGVLVTVVMRRGLNIMKGWVNAELKEERSVTTHEASIVNQFENVDDILAPFAERFGTQKTALAREILLAQAHIGIYRKTAALHQDEKMRAAAEKEVAELRLTMNANRKKIGTYCMLYLRNVFPEDGSPLWGRLEGLIQSKGAASKSQAGTGVWISLDKKVRDTETAPKTEGG